MESRSTSKPGERKVTFDLPTVSLTHATASLTQSTASLAPAAASATTATSYNANNIDLLSASLFYEINPVPPPAKHRPSSTYKMHRRLDDNNNKSSPHIISIVTKSADASARFFYKENKNKQPKSSFMFELESFSWGCYHLLVPQYVPASTRAIYNAKPDMHEYVGISSKAIPGFKSTKEHSLKESDLSLSVFDKGVTIAEMEQIDLRMQANQEFDNRDDNDVITDLPRENHSSIPVTVRDLKCYRIVKGLGCSLTASYLFEEDDLHRGNLSPEGYRIDFDMSFWSILTKFKSCGLLNDYVRNSNVNGKFEIHADDIRNFPNLSHASPYYWPTKPTNISNQIVSVISTNPWNTEENKIYQKLSSHPVFNYFKYQTLLKFAILNADTYRSIAEMHIRPELIHENQSIIDLLTQHITNRIQAFRQVLKDMPEFASFLEAHGDAALKSILVDINASNGRYQCKIDKTDQLLDRLKNSKHEDIVAIATKLYIPTQHATDQTLKDQITRTLNAKNNIYRKQIIDTQSLINEFNKLKSPCATSNQQVQPAQDQRSYGEGQSLIETLQDEMRTLIAQARAAQAAAATQAAQAAQAAQTQVTQTMTPIVTSPVPLFK